MRAKLALLTVLAACIAAVSQIGPEIVPGSPLPGITRFELERFRLGREDFLEVETAEEGLGPAFNGTSCAACHNVPAVGGTSTIAEVRAGLRGDDGVFVELHGGTLFHLFSIPDHRCHPQIPAKANVIARRVPIPLFGIGLVEAIADETITALEDPDDADGDGIRGRAARITDVATGLPRIGRFGWKAQQATLLAFSGDAYRNEMGITNDLFREEIALGVDPAQMKLCGARPSTAAPEDRRDRQTGLRGIDNFEAFMKFLAPAGRGPVDESARRGEQVFRRIGCASCHVPALTTAASANPVFDRKTVALFSNLLLHDVGTGDGIPQAAATANEIRTPALWGLRLRRPLLHDGSAATIEAAILRHGNEAERAANAFRELVDGTKRDLLAFLNSL